MSANARTVIFRIGCIVVAASLAGCAGSGTGSNPDLTPPSTTQSQSGARSSNANAPFRYAVRPKTRFIAPAILHSNCAGAATCATPTTIQTGYSFPVGNAGAGQTIVIVDPFGSPTIASDLDTFDQTFGLTPVNTPGNPTFKVMYPGGKPTFQPGNTAQVNFALETSLDVEWAHVAAPGANIVLVVPANDQGQTVQSAQSFAIQNHLGNVMSLSFGVQEPAINGGANNTQLQQAEANYRAAKAAGITVIASVGDSGAGGGFSFPNSQYPASSPNVLSVGGTNLILFNNNRYRNESAWNDGNNCLSPCVLGPDGATGGAPSIIFPAQGYQRTVLGNTMRTTSDVAYNASPNTGVAIYVGFGSRVPSLGKNGFYAVGGTSQGPPQWAGIIAAANSLRALVGKSPVGFVNDNLYAIAASTALAKSPAFHDVTSGNNFFPSASSPGFSAGTGYDLPTGLGSPNVTSLIAALAALP